jgi:hypothetical protein
MGMRVYAAPSVSTVEDAASPIEGIEEGELTMEMVSTPCWKK